MQSVWNFINVIIIKISGIISKIIYKENYQVVISRNVYEMEHAMLEGEFNNIDLCSILTEGIYQ